jgi:hypothetical protein
VPSGNDYSAQLTIGAKGAVANVILDTGSSTLAVEPAVYSGAGDKDLNPTTLIQLVTYGTGGWAGPVVNTTLTFSLGTGQVVLPTCPIAITSVQEKGDFQGVTGIMGLAYNGLNNAFDFKTYLAGQGLDLSVALRQGLADLPLRLSHAAATGPGDRGRGEALLRPG